MARTEKSIEIKAAPEKVWEMLALNRMPEWTDDWKSAAFTPEIRSPENKYRIGSSAHVTEKWKGYDLKITESIKNEKITYRSEGISGWPEKWNRVDMTPTNTLKPLEGGTEVTYGASCGGGLPARIFGDESMWKGETSLDNLKRILEKKTKI